MLSRRGFLSGIITAGIAPAIIRTPRLLMPVKPLSPWPLSFNGVEVWPDSIHSHLQKAQQLKNEMALNLINMQASRFHSGGPDLMIVDKKWFNVFQKVAGESYA